MSETMISALLWSNFILLFIAYVITLKALKDLREKQQNTIYGISHIWGSIKELRAEMSLKQMMSELPIPPPPTHFAIESNISEISEEVEINA